MPLIQSSSRHVNRVKPGPLSGAQGFTPESGFSVSGTLSDGETITITGTGFGTKSPAKPYLWAPFEGSVDPSSLGTITAWDQLEFTEYAAGEGISGSGAIKSINSGSEGTWTAGVFASGFAWNDYGQKMYLFRRVKQSFEITMNWKILRLWPSSGTQPNWYIAANNGDWSLSPPSTVDNTGYPYGANLSLVKGTANTWKTEEILVQSNSATNVSDAIFQHYVHGALVGQFPYSGNNLRLKEDAWTSISKIYPVHGVMANTTIEPEYTHWSDDVYLDTTWARVMIGDASTFATSTVREIQIPSAWSSTEISAVLHFGTLSSLSGKYLYVIDSSNTAIKIGVFT